MAGLDPGASGRDPLSARPPLLRPVTGGPQARRAGAATPQGALTRLPLDTLGYARPIMWAGLAPAEGGGLGAAPPAGVRFAGGESRSDHDHNECQVAGCTPGGASTPNPAEAAGCACLTVGPYSL